MSRHCSARTLDNEVENETARKTRLGFAGALALLVTICASACGARYTYNPDDWSGPQGRDFRSDVAACKERKASAGVRIFGDSRDIFLECMERRGWRPKKKS